MNLADPGFETGTGWDFAQNSARVSLGIEHTGSWMGRVRSTVVLPPTFPPTFLPGILRTETLTASVGDPVGLSLWANGSAAGSVTLVVSLDLGDGVFTPLDTLTSASAPDWTEVDLGVFRAVGTSVRAQFRADGSTTGNWYLDDVFLAVGAVSIYGTFTAKKWFAQTLRDYLPAEVSAINTENPAAGLALTVPASSDIVTYGLAGPGQSYDFTRSPVLFEVLCESAVDKDWALAEVSPGVLTQDHDITLRISMADRTDGAIRSLYEAVELYVAACDRVVVIERNQLGNGPTIESCAPVSVAFGNVDPNKAVRQATRRYIVRTREVNS